MRTVILSLLLASAAAPLVAQTVPAVEEKSIDQLQAMMAGGTSSEAITQAYLARIAGMDRTGPTLRAVIAVNPDAVTQARAADARRKARCWSMSSSPSSTDSARPKASFCIPN